MGQATEPGGDMEWRGRRQSRNIEDRRSAPGGRGKAAGGIGVLAIVIVGYFLGIDLTPLLNDAARNGSGAGSTEPVAEMTEADRAAGEFVAVSLGYTEDIWAQEFKDQLGRRYDPVTLVLFKGATASPCGGASGATGPFYCPSDRKVYLDTDFFTTMERQLGARGDFAMAYVVAHEVAHHVQNELGILQQANQIRSQASERESNRISVMIELQADCLSGIWARGVHKEFGAVEKGDFQEALNAARAIGDDTLQRNAGRQPMPHTFTHGTSAQRARWFETGLRSGDLDACNTFAADDL